MHDIEMLAVWFFSVIAGMVFTMVMPRIVSRSGGSEVTQEACQAISAHHGVEERASSMILIRKEA